MTSPLFGDLRSVLQAPPSEVIWEAVCALLDAHINTLSAHEWEQASNYLQSALSHWEASLCAAPEGWLERLFAGAPPAQLIVARMISTVGQDVGDEQVFEMTLAPELRHVEVLRMGYEHRVSWRPERLDYGCVRELVTCPFLSHLRELALTGQHLTPDSFAALLDGRNQFRDLHVLDFSYNDLSFLRTKDLAGLRAVHAIESLSLRDTNLNRQGFEALAALDLNHLRGLDLSRNEQLSTIDIVDVLETSHASYSGLERLSLAHTGGSPGALWQLFDELRFPSLAHLHLSISDITDRAKRVDKERDALELIEALANLHQLEELESFHLTNLSMEGWQVEVARALSPERLKGLSSLTFERCGLGRAHAGWLAGLLRAGVKTLDCSHNEITLETLRMIAHRVEADPPKTPATLVLDHTRIDPDEDDTKELIAHMKATCHVTVCVEHFDVVHGYDLFAVYDEATPRIEGEEEGVR